MAPDIPEQAITEAGEAIEDVAVALIGRDLGTVHRDAIVRAGLVAAYPHIAARALRDAADELVTHGADTGLGRTVDRHPSARRWLRERADRLEAGHHG